MPFFSREIPYDRKRLLERAGQATRRAVLISDLRRSLVGFGIAWVIVRCLTTSPVVHVDGPRSVRAAYSLDEIGRIADRADRANRRIRSGWC